MNEILLICEGVAQIVDGLHVNTAVSGQDAIVITTLSVVGVHVPLLIVQRSVTMSPVVKPFSVVFGEFTLLMFPAVIDGSFVANTDH